MKAGRFVSYSVLYIGVLMFVVFLFEVLVQNRGLSLEPLLALGVSLVSVFIGGHRIRIPELEETPKEHGALTVLTCMFLFGITGWFLSTTIM